MPHDDQIEPARFGLLDDEVGRRGALVHDHLGLDAAGLGCGGIGRGLRFGVGKEFPGHLFGVHVVADIHEIFGHGHDGHLRSQLLGQGNGLSQDRLRERGLIERHENPQVQQDITLPIAGGRFVSGIEPALILAQIDAALAASESEAGIPPRLIDIQPKDGAPQTARDWSEHLQRAFDQKWVRLASFPVVWRDGTRMHDECPLRLKFDIDGDWLPAHRFVPQAERLQLTARMDFAAVTLGLEMLKTRPESADLAINLSAHSLNTPSFQRELLSLLTTHPAATRRLWLEIAETGVLAHFDAFHSLCREIKQLGGRIGIEHFGHRFSEIGRYYDLGIDYLKVDSTFVRDLNTRPGNQVFLKGLVTIAHSIGITVVAEGVGNERELAALMDAGFDAATGPHIRG